MYQPAHGKFEVTDPAALLADLAAEHPATLVSSGPDGFQTSMLPMLYYPAEGDKGVLRGHLARGNRHWRQLAADGHAIAIFIGPDAYITPSWYEEKRLNGKVVPTWNYVTVVVHGRIELRREPDWLLAHVRRLVERHEQGRTEPWSVDDAPEGYVESQAKAIVGLEMRIERINAKRKLSQNRSEADVAGVIDGLAEGTWRERAVRWAMTDGGAAGKGSSGSK